MVRITVLCFGRLRELLPDPAEGRAVVDIEQPATIQGVLDKLGATPSLLHSALVDGTRADLDHELRDGAEVTLMPPFAGGST